MNVLVRGIFSELNESVQIDSEGFTFTADYHDNPVTPLFPHVDVAFIVGVIMSLLALAFSYDAVSGERESGVLKLVMSYSMPRDQFLLGKWIGSYLALVTPFVVAFLLGLVVTILFPSVEASVDHTLAIVALLLLSLLYLAAVFSLGVLVTCRTRTASTSITVLLLIWVAFILAIPNIAPYVTSEFMPVPSRASVDREKAEVQQEGNRNFREMVRAEQERTGEEEVWDNPEFREKLESYQRELQADMQKVEDGYAARLQDQTRLAGKVARISPLTSFHLAALDLAASGIEQERRFVGAVREFRNTWQEYSRGKMEAAEESEGGRIDLSDYPRFVFEHMSINDRLSQILVDVLLLVMWNVVFFMLAYLSFLRYDVQ